MSEITNVFDLSNLDDIDEKTLSQLKKPKFDKKSKTRNKFKAIFIKKMDRLVSTNV